MRCAPLNGWSVDADAVASESQIDITIIACQLGNVTNEHDFVKTAGRHEPVAPAAPPYRQGPEVRWAWRVSSLRTSGSVASSIANSRFDLALRARSPGCKSSELA